MESKEKHTPSTRKVLLTMEQKDRRNKARRGTRGTEIANRRKQNKEDPDVRKREWRTTKENRSAARAEGLLTMVEKLVDNAETNANEKIAAELKKIVDNAEAEKDAKKKIKA